MSSVAERMHVLFAGFERSHGCYLVPRDAVPDAEGKVTGRRWTAKAGATVKEWERHLAGAGDFGLGVSPIRMDATCGWGAIDVDEYPMDVPALDRRARELGLPLVTCRTKSGGAHLYLFLRAPCPAELVRAKLVEWAAALGHAGVEVFPKQTRIPTEEDHGNWINMPYQAGPNTTRYAYGLSGQALDVEAFLKLAEERAVDEDWLRSYQVSTAPEGAEEEFFEGAPPCLVTLGQRGFGDWQNNGMFNVSVYLKKRFGDGWEELAQTYNETLMDPPLAPGELAGLVKSINKKAYSYKCKDEPLCGVCNKEVCATRDFGVGGGAKDPGLAFGDLVKLTTDPPTWIWEVDGAKVELSSEELLNQNLFNRRVMDVTNKLPFTMKGPAWQKFVRLALETVVTVDVPMDATREGQLREHLQAFCTGRARARSMDEMLLRKPYKDEERGRTYFRSSDFIAYLQQNRVAGVSERSLYAWLRREGMESHYEVLKGKGVNCWSVPSFEEQTKDHDVPRVKNEEM